MKKALRFIKLYGWIIILIIIVFLCIAYFGVLSPCCHAASPRCAFDKPFKCEEFQIIGDDGSGHGIVRFKAINTAESAKFSFTATMEGGITKTFPLGGQTLITDCTVQPGDGIDIAQREFIEVTCIFNGTFSQGDNARIDIQSSTGSNGTIFGRAQ